MNQQQYKTVIITRDSSYSQKSKDRLISLYQVYF